MFSQKLTENPFQSFLDLQFYLSGFIEYFNHEWCFLQCIFLMGREKTEL